MSTPCERFAAALIGNGADRTRGVLAPHVETCLRCQAELARHRRMLRVLGELRDEEVPSPPSMLDDVLGTIGRAATRSAARSALARRGILSGIGVGGAAMLLGGVVAIERSRAGRGRRLRRSVGAS